MPLWVSIPVVLALWLSCWISGLDSTGSLVDAYAVWAVTIVATLLLVFRLARGAIAQRGLRL